MERIRHLGVHVGYQAVAVVLPFLLLPVITHYVPPEQYGQYAIYMAVVSFTSPLLLMGMEFVLTTDYFKYKPAERRTLISTYSVLLGAGVLLMEAVLLAGHQIFQQWLGVTFAELMMLGVISCLLSIMHIGQIVTMMEKRLGYQGLFVLGKVMMTYTVSVPMVIWVSATWHSLLWAQVVAFMVLASVGASFIWRKKMLTLAFSKPVAKTILMAAAPLIVFSTTVNAAILVDRMIIRHFMTLHDVGIYTMAIMILSLGLLFFQAISRVVWPWVARNMVEADEIVRRQVVKVVYLFWAFIVVVYVMVALVGGFAIELLTSEQYVMPFLLPQLLAFSIMLNAILGFALYFLSHAKRFVLISVISLCMLGLAAALNVLLIPYLGLLAAAIANGAANLMGVVWCLSAVFKTVDLPWREGFDELKLVVRNDVPVYWRKMRAAWRL